MPHTWLITRTIFSRGKDDVIARPPHFSTPAPLSLCTSLALSPSLCSALSFSIRYFASYYLSVSAMAELGPTWNLSFRGSFILPAGGWEEGCSIDRGRIYRLFRNEASLFVYFLVTSNRCKSIIFQTSPLLEALF